MLLRGADLERSLFVGLVLAATSVSISAQTLMELGVLRSPVGVALLGAAIIDDVLVVLLLAVLIALTAEGGGGALEVVWVVGRMALFLAATMTLGRPLVRRLAATVQRLPVSEGVMATAVVLTLLLAWSAEALGGMAAITGAFLAGLLFAATPQRAQIEDGMHTLAYALLVPVFFVSIGLETDARVLGVEGVPFALLLIGIAVVSKVAGCALGALAAGFDGRDALRLAVGMTSRGEVGLIVATIGLGRGLIDERVFAAVVIMVLVTTLVTPLLLRLLYPRPGPAGA
jgi:Kef-type K+ transport system membrane component KefB